MKTGIDFTERYNELRKFYVQKSPHDYIEHYIKPLLGLYGLDVDEEAFSQLDQNLSGLLYHFGANFFEMTEDAMMSISDDPTHFLFLEPSDFTNAIDTMSTNKMLGFFVYLQNKFTEHFKQFDNGLIPIENEPITYSYAEEKYDFWLMNTISYRRDLFEKTFLLVKNNSNVPIELLLELM